MKILMFSEPFFTMVDLNYIINALLIKQLFGNTVQEFKDKIVFNTTYWGSVRSCFQVVEMLESPWEKQRDVSVN